MSAYCQIARARKTTHNCGMQGGNALGKYQIAQMASHCYIRSVMSKDTLIAKFEALPVSAQKQVETLIAFLSDTTVAKPTRPAGRRFNFAWAGGLADMKDQFTAVELQHHISGLR